MKLFLFIIIEIKLIQKTELKIRISSLLYYKNRSNEIYFSFIRLHTL